MGQKKKPKKMKTKQNKENENRRSKYILPRRTHIPKARDPSIVATELHIWDLIPPGTAIIHCSFIPSMESSVPFVNILFFFLLRSAVLPLTPNLADASPTNNLQDL
jgi:hypothetical protein